MMFGSNEYLPVGLWSEHLLRYRIKDAERASPNMWEASTKGGAASGVAPFDVAEVSYRRRAMGAADTESLDDISEGYRLSMANGVKAFRIPFDSFASSLNINGEDISPLELICTAATETREYSVFGCRAVHLLLKYKWEGFAKASFVQGAPSPLPHSLLLSAASPPVSCTGELRQGACQVHPQRAHYVRVRRTGHAPRGAHAHLRRDV